jgi:hypothetical protein
VSEKISRIFPLFGSGKDPEPNQNSWKLSAEGAGDAQFLRTWFELDSDLDASRRINRGTIMGIVIVCAISGGFWTGVGLLASWLFR